MKIGSRKKDVITLRNSDPVDSSYAKSHADLPNEKMCAFWCLQKETCVTFKHTRNRLTSGEGVCTIRYPMPSS